MKITDGHVLVKPKSKDRIWHKEMAETPWNFSQQAKLWHHQSQQEHFQYLPWDQNSAQSCFDHSLRPNDGNVHNEDALQPTQSYVQKENAPRPSSSNTRVTDSTSSLPTIPNTTVPSLPVPASEFSYVLQTKAFQQ